MRNRKNQIKNWSKRYQVWQIEDAMSGNVWSEWEEAIKAKVRSLLKNNTFDIIDRPKHKQVVGCRTVLTNKVNADGTLRKRKARIVAKGYSQHPGVDFVTIPIDKDVVFKKTNTKEVNKKRPYREA